MVGAGARKYQPMRSATMLMDARQVGPGVVAEQGGASGDRS